MKRHIRIHQIKDIDCPYKFLWLTAAKKYGGPKFEDYQCVWDTVEEFELPDDVLLEALFTKLNVERPVGYKGHSLSVSDIVELDGVKWFVNDIGFIKL